MCEIKLKCLIFLFKADFLARPYARTDWVDLGTKKKEVSVQQGRSRERGRQPLRLSCCGGGGLGWRAG